MKKILLLAVIVLTNFSAFSQDNFNEKPWENKNYPIIIDPYKGNNLDFDKIVTDKRVAAIIHKASQGFKTDGKYIERSKIAQSKKLLYASYHLGTNEDPIRQADYYLSVVKNNLDEPMALDIEDIGGNNITLDNAEKFINRIYEKTKKYPFIYVNNKVFDVINSKYDRKSSFAKCPLWYARFVTTLPKLNNKVWDKVTIWQFSCEINCKQTGKCIYNIPGTSFDIDVNAYNGSLNDLMEFWNNKKTNSVTDLDSFIKQNFNKSSRTKKIQIGKDKQFDCGFNEVYLVEGYNADNELKERYMIYKKGDNFIKSNDFIKWCAEQINFFNLPEFADLVNENQKNEALNRMSITYQDITEFSVNFVSSIPENIPDEPTGKYVTFVSSNDLFSYNFPTKIECEK
jgi:lysozyme